MGVWWWWGAVQDAGPEVKRRKIIHKTSGVEVSKKIKGKESITSTVKKKKKQQYENTGLTTNESGYYGITIEEKEEPIFKSIRQQPGILHTL